MSVLFELPQKIGADILTRWFDNYDAERLILLDEVCCNTTLRPMFLAMLRSKEFVIQEVYNFDHNSNRKTLMFLQWMNIKLKHMSFSVNLFDRDYLFSLDVSAVEKLKVSGLFEVEVRNIQGCVNFINSLPNLKELNTFWMCGDKSDNYEPGINILEINYIPHKNKRMYMISCEEQARYLLKIHPRVLQQLTHIDFVERIKNTAPEILEFVRMIGKYCKSLVKLHIQTHHVPDSVYTDLINQNVGLTRISLGCRADPASALLISLCLSVHGSHLECLYVCCLTKHEEHFFIVRQEIMNHMNGSGKFVMNECVISNHKGQKVCSMFRGNIGEICWAHLLED